MIDWYTMMETIATENKNAYDKIRLDEDAGIPTPEQIIETDNQDAIDSKTSLDEPGKTSTKSTKKKKRLTRVLISWQVHCARS